MNISTEPQHRPKTIQPVPDYNQDAERVTEILVDDSTNRPKSILKNQGPQTTTPQSPPKDQPVHPIRAGILRSPTMDVAPDSHQHKNITCRTTTEAVDLAQSTTITEITLSKPKTRGIKRSLLLEPLPCGETSISPSPLICQSEDEVEGNQLIMADETNMQPESQAAVTNNTPQQDRVRSYLSEQTAEYQRTNHTNGETSTPLPKGEAVRGRGRGPSTHRDSRNEHAIWIPHRCCK